jgi:hypothetical protein
MTGQCNCQQALTAAFEEAALALGGVVADYAIPDEAVWDLARALDRIHERAREQCGANDTAEPDDPDDAEHPAIVHLLTQLRQRASEEPDTARSDRRSR